jgi:hypothetical protein
MTRIELPHRLTAGGRLTWPAATPEAKGDDSRRLLSIVAKTSAPVMVPIVDDQGRAGALPLHLDLAGCRMRDVISIDREHDPKAVVGWGRPRVMAGEDGPMLVVEGEAVLIDEHCAAAELSMLADAGVPFEASIHWDADGARFEELAAGQAAQVNQRTITGPALLAREWSLRNVSITLLGRDSGTGSYFFSANTEGLAMSITPLPSPAPDSAAKPAPTTAATSSQVPPTPDSPPPSPAGAAGDDDEPTEIEPPTGAPGEITARPVPLPEALSLVDQFTARFGAEQGVAYLRQRLSFEQAMALDHDRLTKAVAALQTQLADTNARLAALPVGLRADLAPRFGSGEAKEQPSAASARERALQHVAKQLAARRN